MARDAPIGRSFRKSSEKGGLTRSNLAGASRHEIFTLESGAFHGGASSISKILVGSEVRRAPDDVIEAQMLRFNLPFALYPGAELLQSFPVYLAISGERPISADLLPVCCADAQAVMIDRIQQIPVLRRELIDSGPEESSDASEVVIVFDLPKGSLSFWILKYIKQRQAVTIFRIGAEWFIEAAG